MDDASEATGTPPTVPYDGADAAAVGVAGAEAGAEWAVLDVAAGLLEAPWRRVFVAEGEERLDFLHGQTTAHVASLRAGTGVPALVLTAQGRPLAMVAIYEDGERSWIASTAAHSGGARDALSRFLVADDCEFGRDVAASCLTVAGPRAAAVLEAAGAAGAASLPSWAVVGTVIAGQTVTVFSRGDLRVPAFDVLAADTAGSRSDAGTARDALEAAGAARCGVEALEILRVESGTPRYGVDVDDGRLALEARLEWAIHFAKGCYVGQEVVERAVSRGRVNHELCLLAVPGDAAAGVRVDGGSERDVLTSVVRSPRLGPIALGYLPRAMADTGRVVTLVDGDATAEAEVLPWPRPRSLPGRS